MHHMIKEFIQKAILEDTLDPLGIIPKGDHSALSCLDPLEQKKARLIIKDSGILAGLTVAKEIFLEVDKTLHVELLLEDGAVIQYGDIGLTVSGSATSILLAERLVLNTMQRMSGIATKTRQFVDLISHTDCKILDTRKTTPGFRLFEKWAVRIGGGFNHRIGLYDMIMLKDNHIDFCGGISKAIESVKKYQQENGLQLKVEIEARSLNDVHEIVAIGGVHRIMFDNFSPKNAAEAVKIVGNKFETEISGGVTLQNIDLFKNAGVDFISVGALTHSSSSLDLSLKAF